MAGMLTRIMVLGLMLAATPPAGAQTGRIVALVVSAGGDGARADAVQAALQQLGAETLRADRPGNAQLRSVLKRFAREATDSRAGLIYVDAPVVRFEDRAFILPEGAGLSHPTDLFTQAIPLRAFARSAAQAAEGGAVLATRAEPRTALPAGVDAAAAPPEPAPGSAPVALLEPAAFAALEAILSERSGREEVELGEILDAVAALAGAEVAGRPAAPVFLRAPARAAPAPVPVAAGLAAAPEVPETLEELALLEQSLSRSAKRAIQRQLRGLDHYRGLVDGIFGPQTRAAITAFQQTRNDPATGLLTRRQLLDLRG
ncbi:peptidoglycan-binding domain-containing protein [Mangrovicoccus algicola]|uniref:Peptidoglycan-binding protein n=1 Tax=Mangrovicoccus algicola TaxID=2771008 RepID=A0A8J6YZA1_9RHOB|nr:peptidoglycan-binding domain-containing protein [Mangrovicoccus algicola]MBE3638573.1 peptidoglycan-binding protein [Mangrovicoccus algicola]